MADSDDLFKLEANATRKFTAYDVTFHLGPREPIIT